MTLAQLLALGAGVAAILVVLFMNEKRTPRPPDIRLNDWDGQGRKIKR
jgi:hypothetical protein